jgi:antitoxin FitA
MATIVIRNLDEIVKRKLQVRAALHGRSMEAEARAALAGLFEESPAEEASTVEAYREKADLGTALQRRFAALGGVDLETPPRIFAPSEVPQFDHGLGKAIHELFAPLGGVELAIPERRRSHRKLPTFS